MIYDKKMMVIFETAVILACETIFDNLCACDRDMQYDHNHNKT